MTIGTSRKNREEIRQISVFNTNLIPSSRPSFPQMWVLTSTWDTGFRQDSGKWAPWSPCPPNAAGLWLRTGHSALSSVPGNSTCGCPCLGGKAANLSRRRMASGWLDPSVFAGAKGPGDLKRLDWRSTAARVSNWGQQQSTVVRVLM